MRKTTARAGDFVLQITGEKGGDILLTLSGRVCLDNLSPLGENLQGLWTQKRPGALTMDLGGVTYLDSAGALVLAELEDQARRRGVPWQFAQVPPKVQEILELIDLESSTKPPLRPAPRLPGLLGLVGQGLIKLGTDFLEMVIFLGDLLFALARSGRHFRRIRWDEVLLTMKRMGLDGLPILGLMSLLLGMILAFMSALQLQQFGATVYVASLVGISMVKELGPILTAILVAGRSGSAFAAEIGTMQVNEEVDALLVMGFDPLRFLAVPKVLAAMVVVPILTLYSSLFGIVGGLLIGVALLDLTTYTYINETHSILNLFDIVSSLVKSLVFGVIIAGIGCQRGFRVQGGAEEVGVQTTSAVVASLFMIIVIDSVFAIVLHYVR